MGELVRNIHLNPVRAKMTARPEDYPYGSHRAYLGVEPVGIVDVDPVLRLFGAKKGGARESFAQNVSAGLNQGYRPGLYSPPKGILGSEEFVDAAIHRLGDVGRAVQPTDGRLAPTPMSFQAEPLIAAVERVAGSSRREFFGASKSADSVRCKELIILAGRHLGASVATLADLTGLHTSNISRRSTAAKKTLHKDEILNKLLKDVLHEYRQQN